MSQFVINRVKSHEHNSVLFHWPLECLLKTLFMLTTKKHQSFTSMGSCGENSLVTSGFPSQRATKVESICRSRHHAVLAYVLVTSFTSRVTSASLRIIWMAVFLSHQVQIMACDKALSKPMQGSKLRGAEGQNAHQLTLNAPRLVSVGAKFCSLFKVRYAIQHFPFAPVMATFAPRLYEPGQKIAPYQWS